MSINKKYEKWIKTLGLKKVINASGRMTILGVSSVNENITNVLSQGMQNFVLTDDLIEKSGQQVAKMLGSEGGYIVSSASAGIVQSLAGIIHKGNKKYIDSPIKSVLQDNIAREVVIPKGQNINYGVPMETMFEAAGASVIEAGWANECTIEQVESQINQNTVALIYVVSHHSVQKSVISLLDYHKIAKKYKIPLVIDIAAEEDGIKYAKLGIDVIIWSGSKAVEGPSSGFVFGKKKYIDYIKMEHNGIGRSMKVDKGIFFGALEALETFLNTKKIFDTNLLNEIAKQLSKINDIDVSIAKDSVGRNFSRIQIKNNSKLVSTKKVINQLKSGQVAIYTRNYYVNENIILIDVRPLKTGDEKIIIKRFNDIFKK